MLEGHSSLPGSSPQRAVPLGANVTTKIERGSREPATQTYDLDLCVLEVVRDVEARERAATAGLGAPAPGHEYVLALIRFGYSRRARGGTEAPDYTLLPEQFVATSADGATEYTAPELPQQPEPGLVGTPILLNQQREGWVALQVAENEAAPLLAFHRELIENKYAVRRAVWLRLDRPDPMRVECGTSGDCL